jgi:hypothetical protein
LLFTFSLFTSFMQGGEIFKNGKDDSERVHG